MSRAVGWAWGAAVAAASFVFAAGAPGGAGAVAPAAEVACRCAQRPLADYFAAATEVVMGRLVGVGDEGDVRILHLEVVAPLWKAEPVEGGQRPVPGDRVVYRTARSTAACGVQPVEGAVYLAFATPTPEAGRWVDTCSGTRIHAGGDTGDAGEGFVDVPHRFVVSQLDALSGLDALREVAAWAPDPGDPENATLVGLLDLAPLAHGGVVRVRGAPRAEAPLLATVAGYDEVEAREIGYEVGAAVVLARLSGWYRVRLSDGRTGWIAAEEAGTWFPYVELPVRRLTYLTEAWSGHVWPAPGAGVPARSRRTPTADQEVPVRVVESRMVGGIPWFRIEVLTADPCDGPEKALPELGGWIPAYGPRGDPTIWYWSRGC